MMRAIILVLVLTLGGCSAIAGGTLARILVPSASQGISADAELTVGKKEEELTVDTQVGDSSSQNAQKIENWDTGMKWWQFLIFGIVAGWGIPDIKTCGRGVIILLRTVLPWSRG